MSETILVRLPDGSLVDKPQHELTSDDRVVLDSPESFRELDEARKRLDAEISAAGGIEKWRRHGAGKGPAESDKDGAGGNRGGGGSGGDAGLDLDPLLIALLQKIPPQGQSWTRDRRLRWFKTFAMNVSEVYDVDGDPVELNISVVDQGGTQSGGIPGGGLA